MKGSFRVRVCPCCGQPTCVRNDAERFFNKKEKVVVEE